MNNVPYHITESDLFTSGVSGYHTYRIPAIVTSRTGTLLAFCEGRRDSRSDSGKIDILLRRSTDNGNTWSEFDVIASDGEDTCGNPAPVVDCQTGTLWLLFCKNLADGDETAICEGKAPRTVFKMSSTDDGHTWNNPVEITREVKPKEWSWYATGPCHGIQSESGRLIVPCDHIVMDSLSREDPEFSHIIYSDDHGKTWLLGGSAGEGLDESTVLETSDGWLYLNCRNKYRNSSRGTSRGVAWSSDGGESFSPYIHDANLPDVICQASVCRFTDVRQADRNRVVYSSPTGQDIRYGGRNHLTIRMSYDECRNWQTAKILFTGFAAYSDLCVTPEHDVCCLYERGRQLPLETITFARFDVGWLTDGADRIK